MARDITQPAHAALVMAWDGGIIVAHMDDVVIRIDDIYVPAKRRQSLNPAAVERLATDIMEEGQRMPILVRRDNKRFVLVDGLQRLEACKALGEQTITAIIVQAQKSM